MHHFQNSVLITSAIVEVANLVYPKAKHLAHYWFNVIFKVKCIFDDVITCHKQELNNKYLIFLDSKDDNEISFKYLAEHKPQ